MVSADDVINEQYRNAYTSGMGFLMKHFLRITSNPTKYNTLDKLITEGNSYFIESNSVDTLMQIAAFVMHKNVFHIGDSGYPNFKGFSFRHYKKMMDDMMSKSNDYQIATTNDILMVYFPRAVYGYEKIVQCLSPAITSRDNDRYINLVLTTNPTLSQYFKSSDMTSDRSLIYKQVNLAQTDLIKAKGNSNNKIVGTSNKGIIQ